MKEYLFPMPDEIDLARERLRRLAENDPRPWVVCYSGGKDSTLLLQLVCEAARGYTHYYPKVVYVVFNDTLYECGDKLERIEKNFKRFRKIGLKTESTIPAFGKSILCFIVGQGCAPPDHRFRYCTSYSKVMPALRFERSIAAGMCREDGKPRGCVVLSGTRKEESSDRRRRLTANGAPDALVPERKTLNIDVFNPLADVATSELWAYLRDLKTFAWGEPFEELKALYPGDTVAQRDGCWLCTVCSEKSFNAKAATDGQNEIRRFLRTIKEDPVKRNLGHSPSRYKLLAQGLASGYFTYEARKEILRFIQRVEGEEGTRYISNAELEAIFNMWSTSRDFPPPDPKEFEEFRRK